MRKDASVEIVGAGFSGLVLAKALVERDWKVCIREASDGAGGLIGTRATPHGPVESAANGMIASGRVEKLASDIGVRLISASSLSRKRYIVREGRPCRWPVGFAGSVALVRGSLRLWKVARAKSPELQRDFPNARESLRSWGERVLGREATHHLLEAALLGIYAGDPERLSARLIVGSLLKGVGRSPRGQLSGTVAPENGMGEWIQALETWLRKRGVEFHYGRPVERLSNSARNDGVLRVLTVPPWKAAEILPPACEWAMRRLQAIEPLPLTTLTLFWNEKPAIRGFGCLFPEGEGPIGALMNSVIFPERSYGATSSETWIFGKSANRDWSAASETELVDAVLDRRARVLGTSRDARPIAVYATRWPKAISHYTIELEEVLGDIAGSHGFPQFGPSLFAFGNWTGRLGLGAIVDQAELFANGLGELN